MSTYERGRRRLFHLRPSGAMQTIRAVSRKRQRPARASSRYLLIINAALIALYGLKPAGLGQGFWLLFLPVIGILVSVLWYWIIKSPADLNRVKFDVIHKLEEHLTAAIYKYEWQLAGRGKARATEQ